MIRTRVREKRQLMQDYDNEVKVYDMKRFENPGGRYIDQVEKRLLARFVVGPEVLEVGVATGRFIQFVKMMHWNYTGIDISRRMLDHALQFEPEAVQADGEQTPLRPSIFDTAICLHTFHFLPDPVKAIQEFHRIIKPGGRLILIFEMDTWLRRLGLKVLVPRSNQFYFKTKEVAELAEKLGFTLITRGPVLNLPMEAYRKLPFTLLQRSIDSSAHTPDFLATLGFIVARKLASGHP